MRLRNPKSDSDSDSGIHVEFLLSGVADAGDAYSGGGAFAQHVSAKAEQFGRSASGALVKLTGAFDQSSCFHETPQVLLVQMDAGERFDNALQLQQSEAWKEEARTLRGDI